MPKIQPFEDRIVVRVEDTETITPGGVIIPENAREQSQSGEIVAVGNGRWLESGDLAHIGLEVGQRVLHSKFGGTEYMEGGVKYLVLSTRDVLAVLT